MRIAATFSRHGTGVPIYPRGAQEPTKGRECPGVAQQASASAVQPRFMAFIPDVQHALVVFLDVMTMGWRSAMAFLSSVSAVLVPPGLRVSVSVSPSGTCECWRLVGVVTRPPQIARVRSGEYGFWRAHCDDGGDSEHKPQTSVPNCMICASLLFQDGFARVALTLSQFVVPHASMERLLSCRVGRDCRLTYGRARCRGSCWLAPMHLCLVLFDATRVTGPIVRKPGRDMCRCSYSVTWAVLEIRAGRPEAYREVPAPYRWPSERREEACRADAVMGDGAK